MRQLIMFLVRFAASVALVVLFAAVMAEWFAGCGEHHVNAKGNAIANECLFVR